MVGNLTESQNLKTLKTRPRALFHTHKEQTQEQWLEQQLCPLTQTIIQQAKLFTSLFLRQLQEYCPLVD